MKGVHLKFASADRDLFPSLSLPSLLFDSVVRISQPLSPFHTFCFSSFRMLLRYTKEYCLVLSWWSFLVTPVTLGKTISSRDELRLLKRDPHVKAVIVGMDVEMTYAKAAHACAYLREVPGCIFISTNQDNTFPADGRILPGGGSCVAMVAWAAERPPTNTGLN